ncbi:MAG: aspartate/glutamate racemase family protein [Pseudomonadota bacterium]
MHIGLIGGIGPAATDFYHRGLIKAVGTGLDLTIAHASAQVLVQNLQAGHQAAQAEIYRRLTVRLQRAGADCVAITSGGGHFCIDAFLPVSPLPVMNLLDLVPPKVAALGLSRVGLLGTALVMETGLYGRLPAAGVETIAPVGPAFGTAAAAYGAMAMRGKVTPEEVETFHGAGREMISAGAEAVVLGGTDLFLAFEDQDPGYPVIDLAALHIEALAEAARVDASRA